MENREITSTNNIIRNGFGQEAGCLRHPVRQDTERTAGFDRHAFLRYKFGSNPIVSSRELSPRAKVEKGFFRSLQNLCEFYTLTVPDTYGMAYPENIAYAFASIKDEFDKKDTGLKLVILQSEHFNTSIATIKSSHTGYDLYFFPVARVYQLWKQDHSAPLADLSLSLFAFLLQQLDVPFFTEYDSFINGCYESVKDFIEQDMEQGYDYEEDMSNELLEEIESIQAAGNDIFCEIASVSRLNRFEHTVNRFRPSNDREKKLLKACKSALKLKQKYPDISIHTAIPNYFEVEDNDVLCVDMYIGFHWGAESSWLEYNTNEYIDNYFCEFSKKQEPSSPQLFNRKVLREKHDLTMQKELIAFFDEVAKSLYTFY